MALVEKVGIVGPALVVIQGTLDIQEFLDLAVNRDIQV